MGMLPEGLVGVPNTGEKAIQMEGIGQASSEVSGRGARWCVDEGQAGLCGQVCASGHQVCPAGDLDRIGSKITGEKEQNGNRAPTAS